MVIFLCELNLQMILSWDQRRSGQHAIHKPTILQERVVSEVTSKMCIRSIITVAGESDRKVNELSEFFGNFPVRTP